VKLSTGSVVAALAAITLAAACGSSDASPADQQGTGYAVCPADIQPTFDSIRTNVFAKSCSNTPGSCHSKDGADLSGGLDLETDPYTALLGTDGMGAPANNISGTVRNGLPPAPTTLRRVVPGDPDNSFIIIKLSTKVRNSVQYGSGMPYPTPGSVCPATLQAIRDWIQAGAKQ